MNEKQTKEQEPTSYMSEVQHYVKRSKLFWQAAFLTIPFDFIVLLLPQPVFNGRNVNYYLIFITMLIVIITANHQLVLQGIILTKKTKQYVTTHKKLFSLITSTFCLILTIIYFFYHITSKETSVLSYIFNFIFYGGTILSLIYSLLQKETLPKENVDYVIPPERIFYLCNARIILPRILSLWAAFLCVSGSIPQIFFLFYSTIAVLVICQAYPCLENYLHKCRSCGKEVLYGSGERGCCQECASTINIKIPKLVLPKPQNPLKKQNKNKRKLPAIVTKVLDYEIINPIATGPNQKKVSVRKLITATKNLKKNKDGENITQSETKLA